MVVVFCLFWDLSQLFLQVYFPSVIFPLFLSVSLATQSSLVLLQGTYWSRLCLSPPSQLYFYSLPLDVYVA